MVCFVLFCFLPKDKLYWAHEPNFLLQFWFHATTQSSRQQDPLCTQQGASLQILEGLPMCWRPQPPKGCSKGLMAAPHIHGQQFFAFYSWYAQLAFKDRFVNSISTGHHTNNSFVGLENDLFGP